MQENPTTASFMFFFIVIILAMIMGANLIFGSIAIILTFVAVIVGIKWNYYNENLNLAWNPPYNPITNMTGESRISHKEWLELSKTSAKKAIKAYNKATGISYWKGINMKNFVLILLGFLIMLFALLGLLW